MISKFKTNLINISKKGSRLGCFFALIIFVPGLIGIFTQNSVPILIGLAGVLLMIIIQVFSYSKHSSISKIKENEFIEFDEDCIRIYKFNNNQKHYWKDMKNIIIRIHDFKGEVYLGSGNITDINTGTLNYISFEQESMKHRYHFYLKNSSDKESIIELVYNNIKPKFNSSDKFKSIHVRQTNEFYN